ncbi:MAG: Fic family protein [Bacillota bacterium]
MNFDEYTKLGEPLKYVKSEAWHTAIGLQEVDGLKPSPYLIEIAKANIEGDITFEDVKNRLNSYYKSQQTRSLIENRTEEADKVSARIAEILSEKTFVFSPAQYIGIHKRIFEGFKFAGAIRDYNITKDEWVLDGDTVYYSSADMINATLDYDFAAEKQFNYKGLADSELIEHFANFISGIWQIHPFCEGNTRAVAVFAIKYLRTLGINATNYIFSTNSWYFRNALVRANYTNAPKNIYANKQFLLNFFDNLILNGEHSLKNREMHINYNDQETAKNVGVNVGRNVGVNLGGNDEKVYNLIKQNNNITNKQIAYSLEISTRTAERICKKLKELGVITRIGSTKTGSWKI